MLVNTSALVDVSADRSPQTGHLARENGRFGNNPGQPNKT